MAHHKRRRPKSSRAGCKSCKPWKQNGCKGAGKGGLRIAVQRQMQAAE